MDSNLSSIDHYSEPFFVLSVGGVCWSYSPDNQAVNLKVVISSLLFAVFTAPVGRLVRRSGREDGSFMRRLAVACPACPVAPADGTGVAPADGTGA